MIIGICGYKGAGKSTVTATAVNLYRNTFVHIGFSDPLYRMFVAMGISERHVYDKTRWDEPLSELGGATLRYACKTLGTEWGRKMIHPDIWTNMTIARCKALPSGSSAIIDNVRFPNEANAVLDAGGTLVAFHRIGLAADLSHESEQHIAAIQADMCEHEFYNRHELQQSASEFFKLLVDINSRNSYC